MKTIERILDYDLKEEEVEGLLIWGMINWCWAKKGFSFDKLLKDNIEHLPLFDNSKKQELLVDLKRICYEHDIEFRFKKGFVASNYRMSAKVYELFHWLPWKYKATLAAIVFTFLNKYAKAAYGNK